jgi:DICT domain-containing protein
MGSKILALRIRHERELRQAEKTAFDHERELRTLWDAHERELRIQAEAAVEKARNIQFQEYERRLEGMNQFRDQLREQANSFLTIERFEREHQAVLDRMERGFTNVTEKIQIEERVSVRSAAQDELLAKIGLNNRWMVGILVTLGIFGATILFHIFGIF